MDFNTTLQRILQEEQKPIHVRIKGTKNYKGEDLYTYVYPLWFADKFPNKKNITGIVKGSVLFDKDKISVQFAIIGKDGKVEKMGHSNYFTPDQLEEI